MVVTERREPPRSDAKKLRQQVSLVTRRMNRRSPFGEAITHYTQLTVTHCAFSGNQANGPIGTSEFGGAIFSEVGSKTQIFSATMSANAATA